MSGCSQSQFSSSQLARSIDRSNKVAIYPLENYTDTPRAGMRAANIAQGLLLAKGYQIENRINDETRKMRESQKQVDALKYKSRYMLVGGVSEWRYKTGIDGEPAVSLQLKLVDLNTSSIKWSAIASDSSWGNDSIGTVAQNLMESMIVNK